MEPVDQGSGCEDRHCALDPLEECSDCHRDQPMFGLIELVCVTTIYIPLMLLGLVGNFLTILVVWLRPHMRTSTYLYLSSMAVSDLLILLLLPLDLYKLWRPRPWPLGDLVCKLTMFLSECCTFCTILHITFLSLERYLAVCWPITAKTLVTRRRTRVLIGCLWLGAALSAAPVLVMVGVEEVQGEDGGFGGRRDDALWTDIETPKAESLIADHVYGKFAENKEFHEITLGGEDQTGWNDSVKTRDGEAEDTETSKEKQNKMKEDEGGGSDTPLFKDMDNSECRCTQYAASSGLLSAMMILSNLYFLVPFCILGLVYSLIGRTLWLRPQSNRKDQSNKNTVKMLGVIVLAFVLCWLPFHVGRTIYMMYPDTHMYLYYLSQYFNLVSSVLFYLSAAINPLLYNLMSGRYRLAVRSLIQPESPSQVHRTRTYTIQQPSTTV
ncbi:growth hormone secretagogue receptor type 1-like [Eucyclogobius newberryi]|uniref:growth hormone secretagogue receptor type 1-like n=1 Tax=Eucyclogobius newberryi TaxID=166745 RepID=UPI003B59B1B6